MSLNSRLRKYGVDVVRARDAVSGYQVALRERPTLLIIRYVVGTGDAQYILTKLRSQVEIDPIPAIVLSDNPLDADIKGRMTRSLGNEGIVSFMTSSILLEDLFVEIEKYCAFRRSPGPRTPQEHVAKDEAQQDFSSSATVAPAATGAEGGIQTAPSDGES
jgi:response regulator RpfG family c-di-GMP phosphodiesterase